MDNYSNSELAQLEALPDKFRQLTIESTSYRNMCGVMYSKLLENGRIIHTFGIDVLKNNNLDFLEDYIARFGKPIGDYTCTLYTAYATIEVKFMKLLNSHSD